MLIVPTVTGTSGLTTSPMNASGLTSPMTHIWAHNQPDAQGERSTRHFTAEALVSGKVSGPSLSLCMGLDVSPDVPVTLGTVRLLLTDLKTDASNVRFASALPHQATAGACMAM